MTNSQKPIKYCRQTQELEHEFVKEFVPFHWSW